MDDFGMRLRGKFDASQSKANEIALKDAAEWLESEVVPNIQKGMEEAANRGLDKAFFKHRYINGYRPGIEDLENLPAHQFLKATCAHLGLDAVVMSHQLLKNRDSKVYPCIEVMITLPSRFRDAEVQPESPS